MPPADALALVVAAEQRLWTPAGKSALAYLRGKRGLVDATIRSARLGVVPPLGLPGHPWGVTIPWFDGARLTLVKIRQPRGTEPKYRELYRHTPTVYPGPGAIKPGRPAIVCEGEFDCLLLTQELGDIAPVVTFGSASSQPNTNDVAAMLAAPVWYVAHDADDAGDAAGSDWLDRAPRARRVRPPVGKDWTESHFSGVNLRRWWQDRIALEVFMARVQSHGIRLDGQIVNPRIGIGTITGRVAYRDPALQGLSKADRLARLTPATEGRVFVRADYRECEPRILHAVLQRRGLIGWDAGDDLYRILAPEGDRDTIKTAVNAIINGGRPEPGATGRLAEFTAAVETYRADLAADARSRGHVLTLAGNPIPLAADVANHAGKAVNRVIQGTAADIFNSAAVNLDSALGPLGKVTFLLHDEIWIECDPGDTLAVATLVRAGMESAAMALGVHIPVRIEPDPEVADELAAERQAIMDVEREPGPAEPPARLTLHIPASSWVPSILPPFRPSAPEVIDAEFDDIPKPAPAAKPVLLGRLKVGRGKLSVVLHCPRCRRSHTHGWVSSDVDAEMHRTSHCQVKNGFKVYTIKLDPAMREHHANIIRDWTEGRCVRRRGER
jgi:hypothetical protein